MNTKAQTQSDITLKVMDNTIIDDATHDNNLYYEMVQEEILSQQQQEQIIREDAAEYKRNYLEELFQVD